MGNTSSSSSRYYQGDLKIPYGTVHKMQHGRVGAVPKMPYGIVGAVPKMPYEIQGFQNMPSNPIDKLMAGVSNQSVCNWFFYMYLLALFSALFQFAFILYSAFIAKNKVMGFSVAIISGIALSIAVIQSLFLYSMCDRSLVNRR